MIAIINSYFNKASIGSTAASLSTASFANPQRPLCKDSVKHKTDSDHTHHLESGALSFPWLITAHANPYSP